MSHTFNVQALRIGLAIVALASLGSPAASQNSLRFPQNAPDKQKGKILEPFTVKDSIEMVHIVDPWENATRAHPQFSPGGDKFFIVTEKGDLSKNLRKYALFIYKVTDIHRPIRVATFRSSSNRNGISRTRWITNDTVALIGEDPGEVPQVYVVNCTKQKRWKLTSAPSGITDFDVTTDQKTIIYSAPWEGDASQTAYKDSHGFAVASEDLSELSSGAWKRPASLFQTYVADLRSGRTRVIKGGPFASIEGRLRLWLSPDGRYAVTERPPFPISENWESYQDPKLHRAIDAVKSFMRSRLQLSFLGQAMLVHTETGEIEPLVNAPLTVAYGMTVVWSQDSRSAIVAGTYLPLDTTTSSQELARRRKQAFIAEFRVSARSFQPIREIPQDEASSIERGQETGTLKVHIQPAEGENGILSDIIYRRKQNLWLPAGGPNPSFGPHPDFRITQALDKWPQLVTTDPVTSKETVIYDPNPQFRYRTLGRVETTDWTGKLGEQWIGGLVYPPGYRATKRYPLVIQTHDFDPSTFLLDGPFTTAMAAQELANQGIVVLQIGEGPLHDETASKPEEGPYNLSAFESAIDHLDELGIIDRDRVGLIGFSRTAYHVKYALTHSKYHFAAATAAEGIDFGYWQYLGVYAMHPAAHGEYGSMYGGTPWRNGWCAWLRDSISFNFDKIRTPLRLEADSNPGAIIEEWETFAALRFLGKPVELIFVPHGEHPVVKPWERMTSQQGDVDWFTFWLKNEEDPDPRKTDQYGRWRELRKLQEENDACGETDNLSGRCKLANSEFWNVRDTRVISGVPGAATRQPGRLDQSGRCHRGPDPSSCCLPDLQ